MIGVRQQREGIRREVFPAPGAALQGNGRRLALRVVLVLADLAARGVGAVVAPFAESIGRARLAYPQADLERPVAVPAGVLAPLQLQGTHQAGGTSKLIERQQPQGVAHDDADPGSGPAAVFRIAQPPQHHGERGEPEIRLRLATAGGKEEEVHELAFRIRGVGEARQVQQEKGELEGTPTGRFGHPFTGQPPRERGGDGVVRDAEGVERVRILR